MWFRLAGADWSGDGNSLGSMNTISGSWTVQCTTSGGISKTTGAGFVTQGGTWTGTFTLATGAEFTSATLTPSTAGTVTSSTSGSTVTVTIKNVSANCTLAVVATGGSTGDGGEDDTPVTPPSGETTSYSLPSADWLTANNMNTSYTLDYIFVDTACLLPAYATFNKIDIVAKTTGSMRVYLLNTRDLSIVDYYTVTASTTGTNTFDISGWTTYDTTKAYYVGVAGLTSGGTLAADYSSTTSIVGHKISLDGATVTTTGKPLGYVIHFDAVVTYCLPTETWLSDYSYTTQFTPGYIFMDTACLLPANATLLSIDVVTAKQSGNIGVYLLSADDMSIVASGTINATIKGGRNSYLSVSGLGSYDTTKSYYVGLAGQTDGGDFGADYNNNGVITGWRFDLDGSKKTSRNYPLGYLVRYTM